MYGMLTGTISSGVLLLREIDPDYKTPASNNLVVGSSYAIVLAAPILVLIGLAAKSTAMCFLTLGLITVYFAALLLFILKAKNKKKSSDATENASAEANDAE
jgi:ESS family glutamate:Na+ symporter